MARGSFRFLVSGEMKKYPRNEQLKPMQLSVHETSDNKSPLSLGRICNWFLPRRNYPFSSSLMRILALDYEILLLNWLRNENSVRFRRRWIVPVLIDFLFQFPFQRYNIIFSTLSFTPLRVALRSKFIKPIHAHVQFFFLKKKNSRCPDYFHAKNKLLIFVLNRKTFFSQERKIVLSYEKKKRKKHSNTHLRRDSIDRSKSAGR